MSTQRLMGFNQRTLSHYYLNLNRLAVMPPSASLSKSSWVFPTPARLPETIGNSESVPLTLSIPGCSLRQPAYRKLYR